MEASADETGRILPVFSPKTARKICLVDGLVIDLLTRLSLHVCEFFDWAACGAAQFIT